MDILLLPDTATDGEWLRSELGHLYHKLEIKEADHNMIISQLGLLPTGFNPNLVVFPKGITVSYWLAVTNHFAEKPLKPQLIFEDTDLNTGTLKWLTANLELYEWPCCKKKPQVENFEPVTTPKTSCQSTSQDKETLYHLRCELFKWYYFDALNSSSKNQDQIFSVQTQIKAITPNSAKVTDSFERLQRQANETASVYQNELLPKLKSGMSNDEARKWISAKYSPKGPKNIQHRRLKTEMKKFFSKGNIDRHAIKKKQAKLEPLTVELLSNGFHPKELTQLPITSRYDVFIDETGANFNEQDTGTEGKYVALVVPDTIQLPALEGFHATDKTADDITKVTNVLLEQPIGLLGFSAFDTVIQLGTGWIDGIKQLVTWVLYLLPDSDENQQLNEVYFHIEQRYQYDSKMGAEVLTGLILANIRAIDERYSNINIHLEFVDKSHPQIGYVDAIAYTWGTANTKNKNSRERFKLAKLDACLFNQQSVHFNKLLNVLNGRGKLLAHEWYQLIQGCYTASSEMSWLTRALEKTNSYLEEHPEVWGSYIQYVEQVIASKNYSPQGLLYAASWLKKYQPSTKYISVELELQLLSIELSASSHVGKSELDLVNTALELIQKVLPENAHLSCHTLLRLFSLQTNNLALSNLESVANLVKMFIQLDNSQAIFGRALYAKLCSTYGQYLAINREFSQAAMQFETSIKHFGSLNDRQVVRREVAQVRCYLLHSLLMLEDEVRAVGILYQLLDDVPLQEISQISDRSDRFIHHAVVKALALRPEWFYREKNSYLNGMPIQVNNGALRKEHPEHWISFYQGLLLQEDHDAFAEKMVTAINQSKLEHPLYQWMEWIITHLSIGFGIPIEQCPQLDEATQLFEDKKGIFRQRETQSVNAKKHTRFDARLTTFSFLLMEWSVMITNQNDHLVYPQHYVLIVSQHNTAGLLACCHFKPQCIYLIATRNFTKQANRLRLALEQVCPESKITILPSFRSQFRYLHNVIQRSFTSLSSLDRLTAIPSFDLLLLFNGRLLCLLLNLLLNV